MSNDKNEDGGHKKNALHLTINSKHYDWYHEYITGMQIRKLGNISHEDEIFLKINGWPDELITNEKEVNLARPGLEHFYSNEKNVEIIIIVNGEAKKWHKKNISFKEVIILAFNSYDENPNIVYTVAYEDGPKENLEGSMTKETEVCIKNKMIFHATATDKS